MANSKKTLALALHTASQWHSSEDEGGRQMLSLSSTRKIHSEAHRAALIREIGLDIISLLRPGFEKEDPLDKTHDIRRLCDLWEIVSASPIGEEWLTDKENLRLNDELFRDGKLY